MPAPGTRHDNDVTRNANIACFLIGLLLFVLVGVHFLNYAPDDVYITLRYAQHLADGQGPVFNVGERVEGFSNPVFLALLALLQPALSSPENMVLAAKLTGLLAGVLAVLFCAVLARRDPEGAGFWGLAPLLAGLSGYFAFWSASGLETGLHALLVLLAVGGYIRALETGRRAWRALAGLAFALVALSRPEGPIFLVAIMIVRGIEMRNDYRRPDIADLFFALLAILPPAVYFFWRHSFYGLWWPNTFYAKAGGGWSTWIDGLRYLLLAIGPALWGNAALLLILLLPLAPWRKTNARSLSLWLAVLAQLVFIVVGGGDWMPGWRFVVPVVPLLALLAPAAGRRLLENIHRRRLADSFRGWLTAAAMVVVLAIAAANLYTVKQLSHRPSGWRGLEVGTFFAPTYMPVVDWLKKEARPGDWLATGEAGLIPYLTGLPTVDCFGLTDAHLARVPGKRHEKVDTAYIFQRAPRFLVIGGVKAGGRTSDFAYGRALLTDPELGKKYVAAFSHDTFVVFVRRPENPS